MGRHSEPERYPTNDRTEQRMREDAERGRAQQDQQGRHDAPPADTPNGDAR